MADIDWEIHVTTNSRYQTGINKRTATVLVNPTVCNGAKGSDKIIFEVSKSDVNSILDKIDSVLSWNHVSRY